MGARRALAAAAALMMVPAPLHTTAQDSASEAIDRALLPYAGTADSARLPDGRTIHLVCMGRGSPVVLLTAGGGGWSVSWAKVQPAVAARTRVCSWDPAGLGLSDPSSHPQTSDNLTSDLQAALEARGIRGPYVAVGHSLGAYVALLLADRRPRDVVGMVLVDPSLPDQAAIFERVTPAQTAWLKARPDPLPQLLHRCAAALRSGTVRRGGPDPDACLRPPPWPPSWPTELRAALDRRVEQAAPSQLAAAMDTFASHLRSTDLDARIAINPRRNYRDMPLVVLTAAGFASPPDYPAAARAEIPAFQREWRRGHDAYAALSTRGVDRVVPGSTHAMPDETPEAVVDAINAVVEEARGALRRP